MWLFPVSFAPDIDYKPRYDADLQEVPPVGVPAFAFAYEGGGDFMEASPTGKSGNYTQLAPLPPAEVMLAQQAALDPSTQMTRVYPAKLAALGPLDAGDLIYGTDRPMLTQRVGLVP